MREKFWLKSGPSQSSMAISLRRHTLIHRNAVLTQPNQKDGREFMYSSSCTAVHVHATNSKIQWSELLQIPYELPYLFSWEISPATCAIFLPKYADTCFVKFTPSLQDVDKKGKSTIQKSTCWKCGKYHSTTKAMNSHKRTCDGYEDESDDDDPKEN